MKSIVRFGNNGYIEVRLKWAGQEMIQVEWHGITSHDDPWWDYLRVLYAYLSPNHKEILYLGKAADNTVRQRWKARDKMKLWDYLDKNGITEHSVIVGYINLERDQRLSQELLADIESLLIKRLQPPGNVQSKKQRISRLGMQIRCSGEWPLEKKQYRDIG